MAGNTVSVADFKLYELLSKIRIIEADPSVGTCALKKNTILMDYMERIESIPRIARYLKSENLCIQRPLNNIHAQFK